MANSHHQTVSTKTSGLENFFLIWLDANANVTSDNKYNQKQLRSIVNHLEIYKNSSDCEQYIKSLSPQDRVILIASGQLGQSLVPQIHELRQVSAIYIFCKDEKRNKEWSRSFDKVKSVVVQLDDLIKKVKEDQILAGKSKEPMHMNFFNASHSTDKSTTDLNGQFIHFLLLIDVLVRMQPSSRDKKKLIEKFVDEYKDNDNQLTIIQEFDKKYKPEEAIWWYTRDTFLYKVLNKALRNQNTELLYLFRFVIRDIYQLLKEHQCQERVCVYRYQNMSNNELQNLQRSIDHFISINSFFSTSTKESIARKFLKPTVSSASSDLHRILFIIDADPRVTKSKPFADITSLSYYQNESEILFMVGCIFRLKKIHKKDLWIIEMELAGDDDNDFKSLFNHYKENYCQDNEIDLQSFGDVLQLMGKNDFAEKIFSGLKDTCSTDDISFASLCYSLGLIYKERKDYDQSLRWFNTALEKRIRSDQSDQLYIGGLHLCIGNIYMEKGNYDEALGCYQTAWKCFKSNNSIDHPDMASLYHGMARTHVCQKRYQTAIEYYQKSLGVQEQHLPSNHPDRALNISGIGDVYRQMKQYEAALKHYKNALEMRKKSLPSAHQDIGSSHRSIGSAYAAMKRWKEALENYQIAASIFNQSLSPQHPNVIEIEKEIKYASRKLK